MTFETGLIIGMALGAFLQTVWWSLVKLAVHEEQRAIDEDNDAP